MKASQEIQADIERLNVRHVRGDGGYGLVRDLQAYASELTVPERTDLRAILLDLVASQHKQMWAVALEVLVQEAAAETAPQLARVLDARGMDEEVVDYVVNGLLRLRYEGVRYRPLIEEALAKLRPMALPNLAAFGLVSQDESLTLAAGYFARELAARNYRHIEANVPPFAYQYTAVDDELLLRLVERIREIHPKAGHRMAQMISDFISTPLFVRKIGKERSAVLCGRLTDF